MSKLSSLVPFFLFSVPVLWRFCVYRHPHFVYTRHLCRLGSNPGPVLALLCECGRPLILRGPVCTVLFCVRPGWHHPVLPCSRYYHIFPLGAIGTILSAYHWLRIDVVHVIWGIPSPKAGKSGSTTCPGYPQGRRVDTLNLAQLAIFCYPEWGFPMLFPQL